MNPRSSQPGRDQHAYIPQHVSEAMGRQLQQNVPAHLRQYVNTDRPTYVPQHAQQQLNEHMQKTMPGHLKGYSGAYVQQKVVQPGLNGMAAQGPRPVTPVAPNPNQLRQDHSNVNAGQYEAQFYNNLFAADQPVAGQQAQTQDLAPPPPQPQPNTSQPQPYDFIMNSGQQQPTSRLPGLPSGASLPQKLLIGLGALLVLIIVIAVVRGLFSGGTNFTGYVSVAQDQQQLLHLLEPQDSTQTQAQATVNPDFITTASLSLTSSQQQVLGYLTQNGQKLDAKQLQLKIDPQNDQRLVTAAAAGTYDQTFKEIMKAEITQYMNDLSAAYNQSPGPKGKAILTDQYDQAELLLKQLGQQ